MALVISVLAFFFLATVVLSPHPATLGRSALVESLLQAGRWLLRHLCKKSRRDRTQRVSLSPVASQALAPASLMLWKPWQAP